MNQAAKIHLLLSILASLLLVSCRRSDPSGFTLESGKVARVETCHIRINHTVIRDDDRFAALNYACGVPESALNADAWWGDKPRPLGFSMRVGSCLLLEETFYCLEEIGPEKASFKATYKWATKDHDHLEIIR